MEMSSDVLMKTTLDSLFVWSDGSAFNADIVFKNGISSLNGDLIIGSVAVRQSQVIGEYFNIHKRQNQLPDQVRQY